MNKKDIDLKALSIRKLIAHDIPKRRKSDDLAEIPVSESIPPLPTRTLDFFTNRLRGTLVKRGQLVEVDPQLQSPTLPPAIMSWLKGSGKNLIGVSHIAARHLYAVQGGSSSEGLLAVSEVSLANSRVLGLMKLPHEAGLSIDPIQVNGKSTLSIKVLDNLTLTENTRVFKAGVFWLDGNKIIGLVSDDQTGEPTDIADFFLSNFLGFRRLRQPQVLTKIFKETVTDYISTAVTNEEDKLRYFNALQVELRSNAKKIEATDFINRHFDDQHKKPLLDELGQRGVPTSAFKKSLALLPKQGTRARLKTQGGLTIFGDAEAMTRIRTQEVDGEHVILIRDTLTTVR